LIKGVTHDNEGRIVQHLSVSTKVAIGLPPTDGKNRPTKLDHFVLLRKKKGPKGIEWELDPELMEHYGTSCKEIPIVLIDDDIENIFPTCYAWWTFTERKCVGDGDSATRRTEKAPNGEPWSPCGKDCPELQDGLCKPSGDLRFVLADFPRLGSVCRIHTTSYRSVRQIHSALQEIQQFTGGRMAGLTAKLVVRPEDMTYFDKKEKKKRTTTIWALSLEVAGEDMKKLISNMTANAKVFIEARKLLGGHVLDVVEDENDLNQEIPPEFSPDERPKREIMKPRRMSETTVEPEPPKQEEPTIQVVGEAEIDAMVKQGLEVGLENKGKVFKFVIDTFKLRSIKGVTSANYIKVMDALREIKPTPEVESSCKQEEPKPAAPSEKPKEKKEPKEGETRQVVGTLEKAELCVNQKDQSKYMELTVANAPGIIISRGPEWMVSLPREVGTRLAVDVRFIGGAWEAEDWWRAPV
jgi:Recombination directionality factor-like